MTTLTEQLEAERQAALQATRDAEDEARLEASRRRAAEQSRLETIRAPIRAGRQAAIEAYPVAAAAYLKAWIELQAYDSISEIREGANHGFGDQPTVLGHADALPDPYSLVRDPAGQAVALRHALVANLRA
jgi:hypothetical protein